MRNPSAWTFETDLATGNVKEGECFRCSHCQRHEHIKPFERPEDIGGLCRSCMGLMCPKCTEKRFDGQQCVPFVATLEQIERAYERRRARASYDGLRF